MKILTLEMLEFLDNAVEEVHQAEIEAAAAEGDDWVHVEDVHSALAKLNGIFIKKLKQLDTEAEDTAVVEEPDLTVPPIEFKGPNDPPDDELLPSSEEKQSMDEKPDHLTVSPVEFVNQFGVVPISVKAKVACKCNEDGSYTVTNVLREDYVAKDLDLNVPIIEFVG